MPELSELFQARRASLQSELSKASDVKAGCDVLTHRLGEIRREYLDQTSEQHTRALFNAVMDAVTSALMAMVSVTQVDFSIRLSATERSAISKRSARRGRQLLSYLPCALCAFLALWLFTDDKIPAMVLAIIAAVASFLTTQKQSTLQKSPDVIGITKIDPTELLRRIERLLQDIDTLMEQPDAPKEQPLELTQSLMESIQMLMEAHLTKDGAFALRALPGMVSALSKQGVAVLMYDDSRVRDFDLLPATVAGETIRPALMKDGKLLSRGQATVKG